MQKRDKIVLISAVIVLSIILLFKLSFLQGLPLSPVNYISNPGFNGSSEWSFGYEPGNGTVNVVNNQLKITRYGFVFQRPAILNNHNGENFTLSFWAKKEDSNVIAYAGIQGYPSWYTDPSRIAKIDSTEWKQYFLNFNTNQINSKDNIFQVVLATDHSNQGTVWFEDIYLSKSVDTTFCQSHTVYSSPSPVPNQGCCFPTAKSFNNKSINGAAMPSNNIILAIPGDISTLNTYLCYNGQIFYRLSNQTYYWTTYKPTCSIVGNYYASQTGKYGEWKQGDGNGVDIGDGKVCDGNGEIKLIKDFQVEDNPTNNQSNDIPNNDQFNDTSTNDSVDIPYENPNGKIWYVRPLASNGLYGNGDGSSYDNAWNGLKNVLWGDNGVKAGDSLYVCGTNVYKTNSMNNIADQANIVIGASGTSEKPITIRMDCHDSSGNDDKGIVWGVFRDDSTDVKWNLENNGVYSTTNLKYGAAVEFNGSDYIWLNKMNNPNFDNNGAYYSTPKKDQDWLTDKTYVKTSDGTNPTGKIYSPTLGYTFDLAGNDYINFYKCNLYGSVIRKNRVKDFPNGPIPDHITIDSCDIKYSLDYGSLFDLYKGHDYWTIKNSELSYATNAIYTKTFDGIPGARFLKVENNYIHDIGGPNFIHQDAHAVGIQGGEGHIIQNNTIENTGSAIEFWSSSDSMFNMTVRNNFIKNIRVMSTTGGNGIVISGDNKFATSGRRTGFRIYNNIIINTGIGATEADWQGFGISSNNVDRVEIYNNVLYNNLGGIRLSPNTIFVYGSVYNNIIVNPQSEIYAKISGNKFFLDWDNNLYYPLSSLKDTDSYSLFGLRETNSILADPMFVSLNPSNKTDFKLKENSPAIDKGKDVGLSKDSLGNDIDGNPDIGAYEIK